MSAVPRLGAEEHLDVDRIAGIGGKDETGSWLVCPSAIDDRGCDDCDCQGDRRTGDYESAC